MKQLKMRILALWACVCLLVAGALAGVPVSAYASEAQGSAGDAADTTAMEGAAADSEAATSDDAGAASDAGEPQAIVLGPGVIVLLIGVAIVGIAQHHVMEKDGLLDEDPHAQYPSEKRRR